MNTPKHNKIVIAGGTGFLGNHLANKMSKVFRHVYILSRHAHPAIGNIEFFEWDGVHPGPWMNLIDGCDVLVNLAGKSVNCRYTEENKAEILDSRLKSTLILGAAVVMANRPPAVWLNSSTATIYNHSLEKGNDETSNNFGEDFSVSVAKQWEYTFFDIPTPGTRKIAMRTAIVLGKEGGAFPVLRRLSRFSLGGSQGSGQQMVSWLHEDDFCGITQHLIDHVDIEGVVNCCSPHPVRNEKLMQTFSKFSLLKFQFHQPEWMIKAGSKVLGTESELVLKSRWAIPKKLMNSGYQFLYGDIERTLQALHDETLA
jgi:uncharacterized protein